MEKNHIKRLPVTRGGQIVGIVSRANLLQAVASLARQIPIPLLTTITFETASLRRSARTTGVRTGLSVIVRDGIVHLSGIITDDRSRQATIVCHGKRHRSEQGPRPSVLGRPDVRDVLKCPRPAAGRGLATQSRRPARNGNDRGWCHPQLTRHYLPSGIHSGPARTGEAHACDQIFPLLKSLVRLNATAPA